jgi:nucleotide-binding universal stress UspA family protein
LTYAINLARETHSDLHLMHVLQPGATPKFNDSLRDDAVRTSMLYRLETIRQTIQLSEGIACEFDVVSGRIPVEICRTAAERNCWLVVMSTFGCSAIKEFLTGNNTIEVIERSAIPVLVLPGKTTFNTIGRIVFATDYHSSDIDDIREIAFLASHFNATIQAVHIVNRFEEEDDDIDPGEVGYFSSLIRKHVAYSRITCEEYQHTDVSEGIRSYADEEFADIIALSKRHQNFVQRLFRQSVTRDFVFDLDKPLLVFHAREEKL